MKSLFIQVVTALILISCSAKNANEKTATELRQMQDNELDSLNEIRGKQLGEKYSAITGWDTLKFTSQLQDLVSSSSHPILLYGSIIDIAKVSRDYYLKINVHDDNHYFVTFLASVKVDSSRIDKMYKDLQTKRFISHPGYFVFNLSSVKEFSPTLTAETYATDGEDGARLHIDDRHFGVALNGDLVDYCIDTQFE
jgi:hypothetical protein